MVRRCPGARWLVAGTVACAVGVQPRGQTLAEPRPQPAIAAVVNAFRSFPLVAIGEFHRNQQVHDFIVALLRDRGFQNEVNDIVVEFGNARYQSLIDDYIEGRPVPVEQLRRVWRDTVNILVWDAPVYERVFTTVRAINQTRPPGSRLRVLLGGPAIDWAAIHRRDEWERVANTTDAHAAAIVEREVLGKRRRGLLIFGSGHVTRDRSYDADGRSPARSPNLAEILETRRPGAALLVWFHMPGWMTNDLDKQLADWPSPALAMLSGTWLGAANVGPAGTPTLQDLADAFLYLGPTSSLTPSTPPIETYSDRAYLRELIRRNEIQGGFNTIELKGLEQRFPIR